MTNQKIVIITGTNSGMGLALTKKRLKDGDTVIATVRNKDKQYVLEKHIAKYLPYYKGQLFIKRLDLTSFNSIDIFCSDILHSFTHIDALVCNAGALLSQYQFTKDGYEAQMQTHFIANLIICIKLMPALVNSQDPKIIQICSNPIGKVQIQSFEDLFQKATISSNDFNALNSFYESNLAQLLLSYYLQMQFPVKSYAVYPGPVNTGMNASHTFGISHIKNAYNHFVKGYLQPDQATKTTNFLLTTHKKVENGQFYKNKTIIDTQQLFDNKTYIFNTVDRFAQHIGLLKKLET